ncbi:MAG: hypothetical protein NTW86_02965, partial [Candidatus Sumerlaeota bacterium]|nr:hypothetical protein [Candidatus Sumerlaeota bacterium]
NILPPDRSLANYSPDSVVDGVPSLVDNSTIGFFAVKDGVRYQVAMTPDPYGVIKQFTYDEENRNVFIKTGGGCLLYNVDTHQRWDFPDCSPGTESENTYYYVPKHAFVVVQQFVLNNSETEYTDEKLLVLDYSLRTLGEIPLSRKEGRKSVTAIGASAESVVIALSGKGGYTCEVYGIDEKE